MHTLISLLEFVSVLLLSTCTQVCMHTHPCQTPGGKQALSNVQGDADKSSYISHLNFLRIQTRMAWPIRKAPVLMGRAHVLP